MLMYDNQNSNDIVISLKKRDIKSIEKSIKNAIKVNEELKVNFKEIEESTIQFRNSTVDWRG